VSSSGRHARRNIHSDANDDSMRVSSSLGHRWAGLTESALFRAPPERIKSASQPWRYAYSVLRAARARGAPVRARAHAN
jgi:hypothetical protein